MRIAFALTALLALAGCGEGETNSAAPVTSATAVATVPPPAGKQWVDVVEKTGDGWYRQGNPDAPVKLLEYGSRSCPTCGRFALEGVEPLREKYIATGQVSYEFRDFIVHPQDLGIALLGRCVSAEAFFPVLDQMFAGQEAFNQKAETITPEIFAQIQTMNRADQARTFAELLGYTDFMKQRGVPEAQVRKCLGDPAAIETFSAQLKDAVDNQGVSGTPTFLINGKKVDASVWSQLEPALRAAGAR